MTESDTGSDLAAIGVHSRRDGDDRVISGAKTFVTNGLYADLYVVVARTNDRARHRGISLIAVEDGTSGFRRGRQLDKIGLRKGELLATELQQAVVHAGLQLHGGYGFMREYPIARAYLDAPIESVFGGTDEMMRRAIGLQLESAYGSAGASR